MNPFLSQKGLNDALEYTANTLALQIGAPLVFAHVRITRGESVAKGYAWDTLGGLRATHIEVGKHDVTKSKTGGDTDPNFEATFQRHIQVFGREATFLDWLTRYFHEELKKPSDDKGVHTTHFIVKEAEPNSLPLAITDSELLISREMLDKLAPVNKCAEYFDWLQRAPDAAIGQLAFVAQRFIGLRHQAFELATSPEGAPDVLAKLAAYYQMPGTAVDNDSMWRFLGALQTALLYLRVAQTHVPTCRAFVSVGASYPAGSKPDEAPLALFSVGLPGPEVQKTIDAVSAVLRDSIRDVVSSLKEAEHTGVTAHTFFCAG